jgi:DNA-binding beta-propeller fold protein YncE
MELTLSAAMRTASMLVLRRENARRVAAALMALLAAAGVYVATTPSRPVHAATIVQPTYVRTIGGQVEAIMYPSGVAVDASGNTIVADTGNYRIEKYQAGTTNLLWSVGVRGAPIGPAGSGHDSFVAPRDVAVDATHVFVADTDNSIVQVLNLSDGSFVQSVKSFSTQKFVDPIGISVGTDGKGNERILVSDGTSGRVYVFDTAFNLQFFIPPTTANEGTRDAATDSAGNIYTADYRGGMVDKYDSTDSTGAVPLAAWGSTSTSDCHDVAKPYGIDVDTADTPNRIYVASSDLEQVKVFDGSSNCLNVGATGSNAIGVKTTNPADSTGLFQLRRVAVGPGSNPLVYAADLWGLKILTYNSTDGTIATTAQPELGNGQYPAVGNLNLPHGIAVDPAANFIFDISAVNQRVDRFNLDGTNPIDWGKKGVDTSSFNWAQGIGYDPATGNVWVANTRNNRIDEFTTSGAPVMSYPSSGRLSSIFYWPMAVAFDPAGNMYVADTYNNRVSAFSISGSTVTQLWTKGSRGSGTNQFIKPWSLVFDSTQTPARLLVADTDNNRIVSLDPTTGAWNGTQPTISKGTAPGFVNKPQGVTVDATGNIWIADTGNDRVEEFTSSGAFAGQMIGTYGLTGNASFNAPQGIGFDSSSPQLLYVADTYNNRIQVYRPSTGSVSVPTYQANYFNAGGIAPMYPSGGGADASGNMYLADSGGSRIDKIDSTNHLSYIVPVSGALANPRKLSIDVSNPADLWITDTGNNQLVEMDTSGNVLQTFGPTSTFPLSLTSPFGNANDASNVYIADTYDHMVIAVAKTDGHTVWATGACSLATPAALSRVRDVTVGSDGNIYAADTDAKRIVEFSPAGACLAAWTGSVSGRVLKSPRALVSDGSGGLWIVEDGSNPTLLHYNNGGTTLFGKTTDAGGFLQPQGVFLNGANVVAADPFAFQVVTFAVAGGVPSASGTGLSFGAPTVGGFNNPFGVAYAPNGDLFVSDMFNQRLEKRTAATNTWTAAGRFGGGVGSMQNPRGISVSPDGLTLILTNSENERIDLFNTSDLSFKQSIVPTCGKMFFPHQTAYDQTDGTYWIADTNNKRILEVNSTGTCLQNWTAGAAFKAPRGIAWDGTNVWVADAQLGEVFQCTPAGVCTVVAKRFGTPTTVSSPWNLTLSGGQLWIADEGAAKIVVMTLTGSPVFTFGGPGTNPNLGQFLSPRSVAVNPVSGQIAVADFGANVISLWH